jgi:hypothetical protein
MRAAVAWALAAVAIAVPVVAQRGAPGAGAAQPDRAPAAAASAQRTPAPAARPREAAVPFAVGETLTYDVSWSFSGTSILQAGTAVATVQEKRPSFGSTAYVLVAEGRPIPIVSRLYSLYYKMDALLDTSSLLSHRGSLYAEEGKAKRTSITQFDRAGRRVLFEEQSDTTTKLQYAVPPLTQDGLSALYTLRTRRLKPGDRLSFPVADSGSLYTVDVTVGQPESVKTRATETMAWPLTGVIKDADGQSEWKNIGAWISVDARHLPVKLQAELPVGEFVLALREVRGT